MEVVHDNTNGYSEKVVINVTDWVTLPDYKIFGYFLSKPFGGSSIRIVGNILASTTYKILFEFYKDATVIGSTSIESGSTTFDYTITSDEPNGNVSINNISVKLIGSTGVIPISVTFQVFMDNNIVLYNNKSENHRIDKTDFLTVVKSVSGTFRESISIISPVFDIEMEEFPNFNYLYIYLFNRYYYVDDIELVRTKLYRIYCHCDVLMSFKNDIKKQFVYVTRQENKINTEIPDTKLPIHNEKKIIYEYPNLKSFLKTGDSYNSLQSQYAITFCSNNSLRKNYDDYGTAISPYNLTSVTLFVNNKNVWSVINKVLGDDNVISSIKSLWNDSSNCFISAKMFPWWLRNESPSDGIGSKSGFSTVSQKTWFIGSKAVTFDEEVEGVFWSGGNNYFNQCRINCGEISFTRRYNDWRDFEPYTIIKIYIPLIGWVQLDNNIVYDNYYGKKFLCRYLIDVVTGNCLFQIYKYVKDGIVVDTIDGKTPDELYVKIIYQFNCDPTTDILIANNNQVEMLRKSLTTALSIGTSLYTHNTVSNFDIEKTAVATAKERGIQRSYKELRMSKLENEKAKLDKKIGNVNIASDFMSGVIQSAKSVNNTNVSNSGLLGFDTCTEFIISYETFVYEIPDNYAHIIGYPSTYSGLLSGVKGYTEVGGVHLENIKNITSEELDEIDSSLRSGVLV